MGGRQQPVYQRGSFKLDWDKRKDGSLRSPYLAVFWYDRSQQRMRSASTGTSNRDDAQTFLDAFYLERATGQAVCHHCGQVRSKATGHLVLDAIANYLALHACNLPSAGAVSARLTHVVGYIKTLPSSAVTCEQIDEGWIARFRSWAEDQPIVSPKGKKRPRSISTVEASVAQLSAAINFAYRRSDTAGPARFRPIPIHELNRTPAHRSDVAELAAMFRYCVDPETTSEGERRRRLGERAALHRFLLISVATLARPDAAHDVSTRPERGQWNSRERVLNLNPKARRQTKKRRPVVPVAWQVATHLDGAPPGYFVGRKSISTAWDAMAKSIGLPGDRGSGVKLIRRSMASLLRSRRVARDQLEMMLGHRPIGSISELYAPFDPDFLCDAKAAIERILEEIETLVPGATRRSFAGQTDVVVPFPKRKCR